MILNAKNLWKRYSRRGETFAAVQDVNLEALPGELTVIFGKSGSGKSTLLSILAGLNAPDEGAVSLNGKDLYSLNDEELSRVRNLNIGYVPQNDASLPNLTVLENVILPAALAGLEDAEAVAQRILNSLDIGQLADEYPSKLSGGELRRVALARALVLSPEVVIADEPTSNLDDENGELVFRILAELSRNGTAVIVSTHDPRGTEFGDRLYTMKGGILSPS
ncbi:MAG: ABC transporter ATP-binding protein [Fibrobacter sp.]|nr:ABC transporter ATP-binding protein [Fibrobacter sp.]